MGSITRTTSRDTVVDFSYPYFISTIGFYTRKPSPAPKFMAILWPYEKMVWILLGLSVPVFSLVYWGFSKIDKKAPNISLVRSTQQVSKMLVMQGKHIIVK